jgi:alkylhydroperoxidase family enzyme
MAAHRGAPGDDPLASHPQLRQFFECWLDTFLFKGKVDPQLRERVILRIMWRCGQAFEWGNHYRLARQVGLTDADVLALRAPEPAPGTPDSVVTVLRAADEVVDQGRITPATMDACRALFADPAVLQEFLYLVAGYRMFATVSASSGREPAGAAWPPDGAGP